MIDQSSQPDPAANLNDAQVSPLQKYQKQPDIATNAVVIPTVEQIHSMSVNDLVALQTVLTQTLLVANQQISKML